MSSSRPSTVTGPISIVRSRPAPALGLYAAPRILCGDQSLVEALEAARECGGPFSFLVIELENGGAPPDEETADSVALLAPIRGAIRGTDAVVVTGPGRFALVLRGARRDHARLVGERLIARLAAARPGAGVILNAGTASWPEDARCVTDLVSRAAEALWEARRAGTGRVWSFARRPRVPLMCAAYHPARRGRPFGQLRDLSLTGLFLETTAAVATGAKITLQFELPGGETVEIEGRVARCEDHGLVPGLGVHFDRDQETSLEAIRQYLDRVE